MIKRVHFNDGLLNGACGQKWFQGIELTDNPLEVTCLRCKATGEYKRALERVQAKEKRYE